MRPSGWVKKSAYLKRTLEIDVTPALRTGDILASIHEVIVQTANGEDVTSTMLEGTPTISGNIVKPVIYGGTSGVHYKVIVRVLTTLGDALEDTLNIFVE